MSKKKTSKAPTARSSAAERKAARHLFEINNRLEALQRDVSQLSRTLAVQANLISDMSPTTKLLEEIQRLHTIAAARKP